MCRLVDGGTGGRVDPELEARDLLMGELGLPGELLLIQPGVFAQGAQALAGAKGIGAPTGDDIPGMDRLFGRQDLLGRTRLSHSGTRSRQELSLRPIRDRMFRDARKRCGLLA